MAIQPYKLSCAIYGHNGDVRSVACTKDGKIVSGSRDMTAKLWAPDESGCGYKEYLTLSSHKNFVSCVCALPPSNKFKNGLIITGSNDKLIRLYDGIQSNPIEILDGHANTVCKIALGIKENTILSSSWDQSAKLWDLSSFKAHAVFFGHEAAVWSVLQLPCGIVVTGSADKKIKIWTSLGDYLKTLQGHTDCIRDLAPSASQQFLSCSNDATIRHWDVESGQCLNVFYGHDHFVYSIFYLDSTRFVTSSEDHTVKLWVGGKVVETIPIPAVSVWSVASMPNGDIVTGSSDGVIRVFSTNVLRHASNEELSAYEEQISNLKNNSFQNVGGIENSNLPGEEALLVQGEAEGQTKIIKVGSEVLAYSWSSLDKKWNLIGQVTGSAESDGEKPKYKGKAYDYVFSVDIEPGKPLLKLPYNKVDDPWQAAQKFIHDNQLSQHFLEEVANFIIKNSDCDKTQGLKEASEFTDPFTGEARYVPGMANVNQNIFSTTSGYQEKKEGTIFSSSYFPQREFLKFDQANINSILEKLLDLNSKILDEKERLPECRIRSLVKICETGTQCKEADIETLDKLLSWPEEMVFPALDIMRLLIRNTEANSLLCKDNLIPRLMVYLSPETRVSSNLMLALRVLTNMFYGESGLSLALKNKLNILNIIERVSSHSNKSVQVATSTLLLNVSVMLFRQLEITDGCEDALIISHRVLLNLTDQEALFRTLVAIGTLAVGFLDVAKKHWASQKKILLKFLSDSTFEFKTKQCCKHLLQLLE